MMCNVLVINSFWGEKKEFDSRLHMMKKLAKTIGNEVLNYLLNIQRRLRALPLLAVLFW